MEVKIVGSHLNSTFMELMTAVEGAGLGVVIGGGYGLFLKRELIAQNDLMTVIREFDVGARSTEDIDMFLDIKIIAETDQTEAMTQLLDDLGFTVKEDAKYYQFIRSVSADGTKTVKVDLQTGPVPEIALPHIRPDGRRIRPKKKGMHLHAHTSPEALGIRDSVLSFGVKCTLEDGTTMACAVNLPQPFTYIMMKVKSFHDKMQQEDLSTTEDIPGKHAWDLIRILGMTTEAEFAASRELSKVFRSEIMYAEVANIVSEYFGEWKSPGTLRALTYGRSLGISVDRSSTERFLALLAELLPVP